MPEAISHTVAAGPRVGPMLSPWGGMGVFMLYAAVALVLAGLALHRRNA